MHEVWLRGRLVGQTEDGGFYPLVPLTEDETVEAKAIANGGPVSGDTEIMGDTEDGASGV